MGLKLADTNRTRRFERGTDTEWVEGAEALGIAPHPDDAGDDAFVVVRTCLSKAEDMTINDATTSERSIGEDGRVILKPPKQSASDPTVFGLLVTAWSLGDKPDAKQYEMLDAGDAAWIDSCIRRAIAEARGEAEGNVASLVKEAQPSDSPGSSAPPEPSST